MKSNNKISVSSGASSIIMIFVVLCLTTFGVLSYLSAQADYKLTKKTLYAMEDYYKADSNVEELLVAIDDYLYTAKDSVYEYDKTRIFSNLSIGKIPPSTQTRIIEIYGDNKILEAEKLKKAYECLVRMIVLKQPSLKVTKYENKEDELSYIVKVNDTYQIETNLIVNYITDDEKNLYKVTSRKLVSTKQWEQEDIVVWGS